MRVEKTVFISYRRTNAPWALALYHALTQHGYDVFFDYKGLASGDFEQSIIENIRARAHFLIVLAPSALERCSEAGDWLRREIEEAIDSGRNIVPLMLESFDFDDPKVAPKLTGELTKLRSYHGLGVSVEYFDAAMEKLRTQFLNVELDTVLQPVSQSARETVVEHQTAAAAATKVSKDILTGQDWFERGYRATDLEETVRCYTEALRLDPNLVKAYTNRGTAYHIKGENDNAIDDYTKALRLDPNYAAAYNNRGWTRASMGDIDGAIVDCNNAIQIDPDSANAYHSRGFAYEQKNDLDAAIADYTKASRLDPNHTKYMDDLRRLKAES